MAFPPARAGRLKISEVIKTSTVAQNQAEAKSLMQAWNPPDSA
jgi:hypothetical protein